MDSRNEGPLEAGEDGAFDLGSPSLITNHEPDGQGSRGKRGDCVGEEQKDLVEEVGDASEKFEDARPELPRDVRNVDAEETSSTSEEARGNGHLQGAIESEMVEVELEKGPSIIAEGLANVQLPMAHPRLSESCPEEEKYDDSEGESEFHDALDTDGGVTKDDKKAREMKETGNGYYKAGNFEDAIDYYTMALEYCPEGDEHKKDKVVYLANRAQAHLQLQEFDDVVFDCTAALELDPSYVKAILRRAHANEQLEKYDLALEDIKTLVEMDPNSRSAKDVARLEKLQTDKTEKMKEEAIGKLKELGNSLLGNFGLSVDNFKMVQDPNTGSYSINFER